MEFVRLLSSIIADHGVYWAPDLPRCHNELSRLLIIPGLNGVCWASWAYRVVAKSLIVYLGLLIGVCWAWPTMLPQRA